MMGSLNDDHKNASVLSVVLMGSYLKHKNPELLKTQIIKGVKTTLVYTVDQYDGGEFKKMMDTFNADCYRQSFDRASLARLVDEKSVNLTNLNDIRSLQEKPKYDRSGLFPSASTVQRMMEDIAVGSADVIGGEISEELDFVFIPPDKLIESIIRNCKLQHRANNSDRPLQFTLHQDLN